jgi:hypothetical protein
MVLYPDNHTEHINTVCGQNEELHIQITWYVYVCITVFRGEIESYRLLLQFFISFKIYFYVSLYRAQWSDIRPERYMILILVSSSGRTS